MSSKGLNGGRSVKEAKGSGSKGAGDKSKYTYHPLSLKELSDESIPVLEKRKASLLLRLRAAEKRNDIASNSIQPRLPNLKSHWDFLLDEVQWMAIDFRQERRFKQAYAKSLAENLEERVASMQRDCSKSLLSLEEVDDSAIREERISKAAAISQCVQSWISSISSLPRTDVQLRKYHELSEGEARIEDAVVSQSSASSRNYDVADMEGINKRAKSSLASSLYKIADSIKSCDSDLYLHEHQRAALKAIFTVNRSGLGALLFGKPWVGKSFICACLVREWLLEQKAKQNQSMEVMTKRKVVVFVGRRCLLRWKAELTRVCQDVVAHVWNQNDDESAHASADIVICALEPIITCMDQSFVDKFSKNWLGILIDVRGLDFELVHLQVNAVNLRKTTNKIVNISHWLTVLSNTFPSGDAGRCLISENNLIPSLDPMDPTSMFERSSPGFSGFKDRVLMSGLLSFIAPAVVGPYAAEWLSWSEENNKRIDQLATYLPHEMLSKVNVILSTWKHPVLGEKFDEAVEKNRERILREFVPASLPIAEVFLADEFEPKCDNESKEMDVSEISEQQVQEELNNQNVELADLNLSPEIAGVTIKEHLLSVEMDTIQLRKYMALLRVLAVNSALSGDDTRLLAHATVLLRRICFHERLLIVDKNIERSFLSDLKRIRENEGKEDCSSSTVPIMHMPPETVLNEETSITCESDVSCQNMKLLEASDFGTTPAPIRANNLLREFRRGFRWC